jgi:aminodeoxyfutalosine synthase
MNAQLQISDARLEPIAQRVLASERLTSEDGLALFQSHDLLAVGWLANHVREQRHGNLV